MNPVDLNLIVSSRHDADYEVRVDCPALVGESQPRQLDTDLIQSLCKESIGYTSQDLETTVKVGLQIYHDLLPDQISVLITKARMKSRERSLHLRFIIRLPGDSLLQMIPWELMHDGHRTLSLDPNISIFRYVEQTEPIKNLRVKGSVLRVLFTTACPPGEMRLDLDREAEITRQAFHPLGNRVSILIEKDISFEQLKFRLLRASKSGRAFHIWHHCGHGGLSENSGEFALLLENEGQRQVVPATHVCEIIQKTGQLKLAIFNTCYSGTQTGLAASLASLNIPATIGFRHQIEDKVALDFVEMFYAGLLVQQPIDLALQAARQVLFDPLRPLDWALPLLFLRSTDARLL